MGRGVALAVEAEPVDDALVLRQAEKAGLGVAGLGQGGDGAHLHKAEAEAKQGVRRLRALVIARSHAQRIGEVETAGADPQARVFKAQGDRRHHPQGEDRGAVGGFRLQRVEQGLQQFRGEADHDRSSEKSCLPSAPSGMGLTQAAALVGRGA